MNVGKVKWQHCVVCVHTAHGRARVFEEKTCQPHREQL